MITKLYIFFDSEREIYRRRHVTKRRILMSTFCQQRYVKNNICEKLNVKQKELTSFFL